MGVAVVKEDVVDHRRQTYFTRQREDNSRVSVECRASRGVSRQGMNGCAHIATQGPSALRIEGDRNVDILNAGPPRTMSDRPSLPHGDVGELGKVWREKLKSAIRALRGDL